MNISADNIVRALKKGKKVITLNAGKCTEADYDVNSKSDNHHLRQILANWLKLMQLHMADTRRIYSHAEYKEAYNILIDKEVTK